MGAAHPSAARGAPAVGVAPQTAAALGVHPSSARGMFAAKPQQVCDSCAALAGCSGRGGQCGQSGATCVHDGRAAAPARGAGGLRHVQQARGDGGRVVLRGVDVPAWCVRVCGGSGPQRRAAAAHTHARVALVPGLAVGGVAGAGTGLRNAPSGHFRIRLNSVLNHMGRTGARLGNGGAVSGEHASVTVCVCVVWSGTSGCVCCRCCCCCCCCCCCWRDLSV